MKPLQMLLIFAFGVLAGALLFKGCGKPVKQIEWVKITDTIRLITKDTFIKIPKPDIKYVILQRDTGKNYTYIEVDTVTNFKIDTVRLNEVVAARNYKDSVDFSGRDVKAVLHYDLLTTGEMLSLNMDMDLFNERVCPDCPVQKKKINVLGANFGYINNSWFASADITRKWVGFGGMYSLKDKSAGGYLRLNFRF